MNTKCLSFCKQLRCIFLNEISTYPESSYKNNLEKQGTLMVPPRFMRWHLKKKSLTLTSLKAVSTFSVHLNIFNI